MQSKMQLESEEETLSWLILKNKESADLTKGMVQILESFETRMSRLESTIEPVYAETESLQRRQENIDKTLGALDSVIAYYDVSAESEAAIKAGPKPLEPFLAVLSRLRAALIYFKTSNPQSIELENVKSLYFLGGSALSREFTESIKKYSKPVPPEDLIKAIEENENLGEQFPEEDSVQNTLIRIAEWLNYNDHDDYMTVYATVRGNVMKKSIDLLRDQYRKPSSPKMDVSTPLSSSNRVSRLSNTINRRLSSVSSRLDISSSSLSKKTPNLPGSAGSTPILSSGSDLNEMEVEIFSQTISGLQKLMASEQRLMVGIIPHSFQQRIFEIIVRDSLDLVLREGEYILLRVKKAVSSHDFLAVITLFLAIRHLSAIAPLMESTLENCDPSVKAKYKSMIHGFFTTGFSALEDFLEVIRGDSTSKEKLPKDGTVFQLTSNVLLFLEQLLEFVDTLAVVLTTQDSSYNQTLLRTETKISVNNRNQALVGLYLDKVLVQLNYTLINKSESYSDQFLKAIFRLNNNQYILRTLNSSGLLRLIDLVQPKRAESYDAMIVEQRQLYLQSWSRILSHIWSPSEDVPIAILQAPGKLGDKYCKMIKDKFAGFNKEMEDISSTQRSYSVPDVELRESLKRDNKEFILHKYQSFYERYVHVQFTKHKEKYIKYTPSQVDHLIDSFFDTAA